jgi:hypothetical protein
LRTGPEDDLLSALEGTRTPNLLIRSQMLYPLSYERIRSASVPLSGGERTDVDGSQKPQGPHPPARWYSVSAAVAFTVGSRSCEALVTPCPANQRECTLK